MHRYEELEELYYKKKRKKIFFTLFSIIFIGGVGYFIYFQFKKTIKSSKNNIKIEKEVNKTIKKPIKVRKEVQKVTSTVQKKPKKEVNKTKNIKLSFVLPQIDKIKEPVSKKPQINKKKKLVSKKQIKKTSTERKKVEVIKVKKVDINKLILVYNKNPNYDLAMTISKEYLKQNKLDQAQIWAIKANSLNPDRIESWLEFADILVKKGNKQKAIEILKTYLDSYGYNEKIDKKIRMLNE